MLTYGTLRAIYEGCMLCSQDASPYGEGVPLKGRGQEREERKEREGVKGKRRAGQGELT